MHTVPPRPLRRTPAYSPRAGFSLVEVSLAIGIIAFAFVALIGLLPGGLTVYRASIDTANETAIMQDLNSMVQVTPFEKVKQLAADGNNKTVYYYDEEGKLTDWVSATGSSTDDKSVKDRRLYAAKLLVDNAERPALDSAEKMQNTYRIVVLFAPYINKRAMDQFETISTPKEVENLKKDSSLHTRSFWYARMNNEFDK